MCIEIKTNENIQFENQIHRYRVTSSHAVDCLKDYLEHNPDCTTFSCSIITNQLTFYAEKIRNSGRNDEIDCQITYWASLLWVWRIMHLNEDSITPTQAVIEHEIARIISDAILFELRNTYNIELTFHGDE
jgi:hypothetical protein